MIGQEIQHKEVRFRLEEPGREILYSVGISAYKATGVEYGDPGETFHPASVQNSA